MHKILLLSDLYDELVMRYHLSGNCICGNQYLQIAMLFLSSSNFLSLIKVNIDIGNNGTSQLCINMKR